MKGRKERGSEGSAGEGASDEEGRQVEGKGRKRGGRTGGGSVGLRRDRRVSALEREEEGKEKERARKGASEGVCVRREENSHLRKHGLPPTHLAPFVDRAFVNAIKAHGSPPKETLSAARLWHHDHRSRNGCNCNCA